MTNKKKKNSGKFVFWGGVISPEMIVLGILAVPVKVVICGCCGCCGCVWLLRV